MMDRYFIATEKEHLNVIPTDEEIKKYGESLKDPVHLGLDTESIEEMTKKLPALSKNDGLKTAWRIMTLKTMKEHNDTTAAHS